MKTHTMTILLTDDEEDVRDVLKYNLLKDGFEVYTFSDGATVLDFAGAHKPDLIIADWLMPVVSGIELVQAIRKNPALRETPFLMISCNNTIGEISKAYLSGVDEYMVKPFRIPELKKSIKRLLNLPA